MTSPDEIRARDANERTVLDFFIFMMRHEVEKLVAIFAEDAVQEQPFVFPGQKPALVGQVEIRANYAMALSKRRDHSFDISTLHRTQDADCVIVEARGVSTLGETDRIYDNKYVAVFRLRDARIAHLRFYFDPLVAQTAFAQIRGLA